ncbi:hypothetical protein M3Y99_01098100 [Aphelenchoides fujianensis]|nr:hypothetical protein M3Y99_01098100 [Aphelenchoides fujianensis]
MKWTNTTEPRTRRGTSTRSKCPQCAPSGQVDYTRLQKPITLPRWSRNAYRQFEPSHVPQLAPEIRVMPLDNLVMYEHPEEDQVEIDPDGQVDVCALEEAEEPEEPPAKQSRSGDAPLDAEPTRNDRYRILRRNTNGETLASRARREQPNFNEDEMVAEYNEMAADGTGEMVQEEVEIVDQDEHLSRYSYLLGVPMLHRRPTYTDPQAVVNLNELYDEMTHHSHLSIDEFNNVFGTESTMSYPLNVMALMGQGKKATAEQNAKTIAALAMQINYMKREISKLREDIVDTRSVTMMRQNYGLTGRHFDLNGPVTQNWFVDAEPPLREVDLVKTAREVSLRIGRKNMKTRDVITRFVRAVFDQMIPEDRVREYTVRDRPSTRGQVKDIGIKCKNQIIGIVLDLMGLYEHEVLNSHSRVDRANFSDFVNQAMKTVIYDMRRLSPKSRKGQARGMSAEHSLEHEGMEEEEE